MDGPAVVHALANISIGWPTWRRERRETRNKNFIWISDDAKMAKYFYPGLAIIWNRIYCCCAGRTESDEPESNTRTRPILVDNILCASPSQVLSFSKYLCVVHGWKTKLPLNRNEISGAMALLGFLWFVCFVLFSNSVSNPYNGIANRERRIYEKANDTVCRACDIRDEK